MKPFNLERALAGDPVVTIHGKKVINIVHLKEAKEDFQVIGVEEGGNIHIVRVDGRLHDGSESAFLYMAPVKKTYHFASWKRSGDVNAMISVRLSSGMYLTEEDMISDLGRFFDWKNSIKHTIEIEE